MAKLYEIEMDIVELVKARGFGELNVSNSVQEK